MEKGHVTHHEQCKVTGSYPLILAYWTRAEDTSGRNPFNEISGLRFENFLGANVSRRVRKVSFHSNSFADVGLLLLVCEFRYWQTRTHCCSWCFLGCANWDTFVADTKCFWTKSATLFVSRHKICVRNKCCARGQTEKHLCRQQCVLVCQGL